MRLWYVLCRCVTRGESQSKRRHRVTQVAVGDVLVMSDTLVALQQRRQRVPEPGICREGWEDQKQHFNLVILRQSVLKIHPTAAVTDCI